MDRLRKGDGGGWGGGERQAWGRGLRKSDSKGRNF